ncbi:hypothetical protein CRUP_028887 [Coryphaenoides rupestris]|nr:hypothetical protein CRUP_028887 [Coryphaenoides rupestris]
MSVLHRVFRTALSCGRSPCRIATGRWSMCGGGGGGAPPPPPPGARASSSASLVHLTYDVFDGKGESCTPLVFLHGLFGSKSNFHSIAKSLVQRTGRKVLTVDARNHGTSPHNPVLTYEAMASDLKHLLTKLHIDKCVLIGHSMGGKPGLVERLVVVDISPSQTTTRTNFRHYINAMQAVAEHSVRQFLLTNLVESNGQYSWRVNLAAISSHLDDIMSFPSLDATYDGPTLFLGGASSAYISSEDYPEIQRLFPNADIQYIPDASHWIHADKPLDFISSIISFLQS